MKRVLLIVVFLLTGYSFFAQEDNNFPSLTTKDIPDGKITRTGSFRGDALWGLINGGADIYLEYGFDKLLLQEIDWRGLKFRIELYRMNNAKSAFGIFSVSRYKCNLNNTITKYICITPYQVQAAIGKFYVSISNDAGNGESQNLTTDLFKKVLTRIKEVGFDLPKTFHEGIFDSHKDRIKYLKGRLGLQNGFPAWSEMFDSYSNYEIYLMPIELEKGYFYISQIKFGSEKEKQKFIAGNLPEKHYEISKIIKTISADEILFIESNLPADEINEFTNSIYDK